MKILFANGDIVEHNPVERSRLSWKQEELNRLVAKSKELDRVKAEIAYLRRYLESDKFWQDTTVQVQDVLTRLPYVQTDF